MDSSKRDTADLTAVNPAVSGAHVTGARASKPPRMLFSNLLTRVPATLEKAHKQAERRLVLVMGGTGLVGGAVARGLLTYPWFCVLVATRRPWSAEAMLLRQAGASIVEVDYNYKHSLVVAMQGVTAMFLHTSYWENYSCIMEVIHGRNAVEAAQEAGVEHVIFNGTNYVKPESGRICSFMLSKLKIEQYLINSGLPYTIVVLPFYFENFLTVFRPFEISPDLFAMTLPLENCLLSCACLNDMAICICKIIQQGSMYMDHKLTLAAEMLSVQQMTTHLTNGLSGLNFIDPALTVEDFLEFHFPGCKDLAAMFRFLQLCEDIPDFSVTRALNPHTRNMSKWIEDNHDQLYEVLDESLFVESHHHGHYRKPPHHRRHWSAKEKFSVKILEPELVDHAHHPDLSKTLSSIDHTNNSQDLDKDSASLQEQEADQTRRKSSSRTLRQRTTATLQKFLTKDFAALRRRMRLRKHAVKPTVSSESLSSPVTDSLSDHQPDHQPDASLGKTSGHLTQADDKGADRCRRTCVSPDHRRWTMPGNEESKIPSCYQEKTIRITVEETETQAAENIPEGGDSRLLRVPPRRPNKGRSSASSAEKVPPEYSPPVEERLSQTESRSVLLQHFEAAEDKPSVSKEPLEVVTRTHAQTQKPPSRHQRSQTRQQPPTLPARQAGKQSQEDSFSQRYNYSNNRTDESGDQDSCFPGTSTRLAVDKRALLQGAFSRGRQLRPNSSHALEEGARFWGYDLDHPVNTDDVSGVDENEIFRDVRDLDYGDVDDVEYLSTDCFVTVSDYDDSDSGDYHHVPTYPFASVSVLNPPLQPFLARKEATVVKEAKINLPSAPSVTEESSSNTSREKGEGERCVAHGAGRSHRQQEDHTPQTDGLPGQKYGAPRDGQNVTTTLTDPQCSRLPPDRHSAQYTSSQSLPDHPGLDSDHAFVSWFSASSFCSLPSSPSVTPSTSSERLFFPAWGSTTQAVCTTKEKLLRRQGFSAQLGSKMRDLQKKAKNEDLAKTFFPQFCLVSSSSEGVAWSDVRSQEGGLGRERTPASSLTATSSSSYGSILLTSEDEGRRAGQWT